MIKSVLIVSWEKNWNCSFNCRELPYSGLLFFTCFSLQWRSEWCARPLQIFWRKFQCFISNPAVKSVWALAVVRVLLLLRETSHHISSHSQGPGDFVLSGNLLQGNSTGKLVCGVPWYILPLLLALPDNKTDVEYCVGIQGDIHHEED